jgi:hypothetical protein
MCERLSQDQRNECNGGQGCCIYKKRDELESFNKRDHAERSLISQPNHRKFWNKMVKTAEIRG